MSVLDPPAKTASTLGPGVHLVTAVHQLHDTFATPATHPSRPPLAARSPLLAPAAVLALPTAPIWPSSAVPDRMLLSASP